MTPALFQASALVIVALALAHSLLGERFILSKTKPTEFPQILGSSRASFSAIRFTWHALSAAWVALAVLLLIVPVEAERSVARVVAALFGIMGVLAAAVSRFRHLAWVGMLAVALMLSFELWAQATSD